MIRKLSLCAVITAISIVVSSLERFVPIQAIIPLPGLKLGIANCIILFLLSKLNLKYTFLVLLCKNLVVSFLFSNPVSFVYSMCGGVLSVLGMFFLLKFPKIFSIIGVSIAGASFFNIGQIVIASITLNSVHIFKYLIFLLPASVFTGFLTGIITVILLKNIKFRWI